MPAVSCVDMLSTSVLNVDALIFSMSLKKRLFLYSLCHALHLLYCAVQRQEVKTALRFGFDFPTLRPTQDRANVSDMRHLMTRLLNTS